MTAPKKVLKHNGLELGLEFLPGEKRKPGFKTLTCAYGHIRLHKGEDFMALDCYVHPDVIANPNIEKDMWTIAQIIPQTGEIDETKIMIGFDNKEEAIAAYKSNIPAKYFGGIAPVSPSQLSLFHRNVQSLRPLSALSEVPLSLARKKSNNITPLDIY